MDQDVVVVGAGMIGSAAAKYLKSQNPALRVGLIGPPEPKTKTEATIHGAHYDEARIARTVDKDATWGVLAARCLPRYRQIESQSGLPVYQETGYLAVGTAGGAYIEKIKAFSESSGQEYVFFKKKEDMEFTFPYAHFGADVHALYTHRESGTLNPRNLVMAQRQIAGKLGCHMIDSIVDSVRVSEDSEGYIIKTQLGVTVTSRKVLLCTGGFTHFKNLLPTGVIPSLKHHPNTVILVEVSDKERHDLQGMPCMTFKGGEWDRPDLNLVAYILPPIKYPDGKYYLKVGHGNIGSRLLHTPKEISDWYWAGRQPEVETFLYDITRSLFPRLEMKNYIFDYCVTANTASGYPYVDLITSTLGVAIGGCGQSAKSSDEIGKMAAQMIARGSWDHDLPEEKFKFKVQKAVQKSSL